MTTAVTQQGQTIQDGRRRAFYSLSGPEAKKPWHCNDEPVKASLQNLVRPLHDREHLGTARDQHSIGFGAQTWLQACADVRWLAPWRKVQHTTFVCRCWHHSQVVPPWGDPPPNGVWHVLRGACTDQTPSLCPLPHRAQPCLVGTDQTPSLWPTVRNPAQPCLVGTDQTPSLWPTVRNLALSVWLVVQSPSDETATPADG